MALAATIYLEARGEAEQGQTAVGYVILTRAERRNLTVAEVCFQSKMVCNALIHQFSCYNSFNSERICRKLKKDNKAWVKCYEIARRILTCPDQLPNPTPGADHYYNPSLCSPSWARDMTIVDIIGGHIFLDSKRRVL